MNETPIEILASELRLPKHEVHVAEVLVPEQCMTVYIDGTAYHVTIEPFDNREENV